MTPLSRPTLLVLTPSLGIRNSLHATIRSVYNYASIPFKHVLIGPYLNLRKYLDLYPHLEILDDNSSQGVFAALNKGLALHNSYTLFAYLNDDDYWLPGFTALVKAIQHDPTLDFCYGRAIFATNDYNNFKCGSYWPFYKNYTSLYRYNIPIFTQQSLIIRRSSFASIGDSFDESYPLSADSIKWIYLTKFLKGVGLNVYASVYSLDPGRLSSLLNSHNSHDAVFDQLLVHTCESTLCIVILICYRLYNLPIYLQRLYYFLTPHHRYLRRHAHYILNRLQRDTPVKP